MKVEKLERHPTSQVIKVAMSRNGADRRHGLPNPMHGGGALAALLAAPASHA